MKQNPTLVIVADNHASGGLIEEHGLSVWIETNGHRILFDAGRGQALENNSRQLGIDLRHIDSFVLSHGHYDHTGAIDFVLQENPEVQVFANPAVLSERYSIYPAKEAREISMPEEQRFLIKNLPDSQLNWVNAPRQIVPGVWLTGPIPRFHPLEDTGGPFFQDLEGRRPDPITDDMAIWIETPRGLLVVCGCCHSGLINTLNHIRKHSRNQRIRGIVGGLHLKSASEERLQATVEALNVFKPDFMVPCHCTGDNAIAYFKQNLLTTIHPGFAGFKIKEDTYEYTEDEP